MRICFIVNEIFRWGVFGGFGFLSRLLSEGLIERGIEVCVLTPRRSDQKRFEILDKINIFGFEFKSPIIPFLKGYSVGEIQNDIRSLLKDISADIYHSQEPSEYTYLVGKLVPSAKHVTTFQDPWSLNEAIEFCNLYTQNPIYLRALIFRTVLYWRGMRHRFIKKAIRKADEIFCQAKFIIPKVARMYNLRHFPKFLPNPVKIATRNLKKSDQPTVSFLARWDPVKRPKLFFELAKKFPGVKFIALGKCHSDPIIDTQLREQYSNVPNLEMPGFVSENEKSKILEQSWILINTSIHECLPISFLEAAAHKCAILSHENPDRFATKFGFKTGLSLESYVKGLKYLLEDERWKFYGDRAHEYVGQVHEFNKVINLHLSIYKNLLSDELA